MRDDGDARGKGPASGKLRLPPLNALRAFHAVARHKSLRQAADELYVTPQAVGQQIKLLEDLLHVTLFERKGRSIEPTEAAVLLAHYVEAGFAEFAEGVRRITRSGYRDRINLNTSPYFATNYLLHHLSEFREEMPNLDLRLTTMIDMPDFARDDIDMTVQWGYGNWGDVECTLLVRDPKMICCTPEIATRLKTPADLLDCTLLDTVRSKRLWNDIFDHLGVAPGDHHGSISLDTRRRCGGRPCRGSGWACCHPTTPRPICARACWWPPSAATCWPTCPRRRCPASICWCRAGICVFRAWRRCIAGWWRRTGPMTCGVTTAPQERAAEASRPASLRAG